MANEKLFHVGAKALLTRPDGTVLVMKTKKFEDGNSHWDLPGGRIQEGQTELDALAREIEEETGLTEFAAPVYFGSCISNIQIPLKDITVGLVLIAYTVPVASDVAVRISEEHTEYEWVTFAEAAERLAHKYPANFTDLLKP